MNAEKQATDAQVVADGETAELDASPGDAEERADTFESETPEPDGGAEIAEEPTDAGPFTAPGADVEIEEIRERMRREFQSQKDREIQRERRRWEADLETLNDGGRQGQWDREETAKPKAGQPGYVAHRPSRGWERPSRGWERPSRGWERPSRGWERPSRGWERPSRGWERGFASSRKWLICRTRTGIRYCGPEISRGL